MLLAGHGCLHVSVVPQYPGFDQHLITRIDSQLVVLKPQITNQEVVGFMTSLKAESVDEARALYMMQYSLAPVLLDRSTHHDFVLGYIGRGCLPQMLKENPHLSPISDTDSRIVLFTRSKSE